MTKVKRSMGMAAVGATFVVVTATPMSPAAGGDLGGESTTMDGFEVRTEGDWIVYDRGKLAEDGTLEVVQGEKADDGTCLMGDSASSRSNVGAVYGVEIEFNPTTCQSKYWVRELTIDERDRVWSDEVGPGVQVDAPAVRVPDVGALGGAASYLPAATKSGWTQSWYEDPPGWDVTYTFVRTTWTYNGSCVSGASGAQEHRHMGQTGWVLLGWDWNNVYSCAKSSSNIYAAYKNDPFCPGSGNTTYNTYNRTRAEGKPDGSTYWAWPAVKSGGCSSLLSHKYLYGN
ncbi:MAG: hypothetical protein DCC50_04270 [Acidobacteria bacterium]|nr:MAG: hypothetical protein DCC50_04270 [Acidobacteriota bacterium]